MPAACHRLPCHTAPLLLLAVFLRRLHTAATVLPAWRTPMNCAPDAPTTLHRLWRYDTALRKTFYLR